MRSGRLCLFVIVAVACALVPSTVGARSPIRFAPAVNYPTGSSSGPGPAPINTVAGDFNSDGRPDIVVCDWFGPAPLVMLNRGHGGFGSSRPIDGAPSIDSLATADLNKDGRLDLVGANGEGVTVILGRGDATFRIGESYPMSPGAQIQAIVVDANGDRSPDVAAVTPSGVRTLIGRGDGTFTPGPLTTITGMLSGLAAARFDRDRRQDLVVVDAFPLMQKVVALKGAGDGGYAQTGSGNVGYGPEAVVGADFNEDGLTDVVTADSFAATDSVLLSDGAGGFMAAATYPAQTGPVSIATADFDRDGAIDFVSSSVAEALEVVFAGDGRGGFTNSGSFPVTDYPQTPVVADFDGDGRVDVAVAGPGQLSVLRNLS